MSKKAKVTYFIELLSIEEIMALYKHFSGVTQVKFKDRQDAEIRLLTISFGKPRHMMVEAFKKVNISEEVTLHYGDLLRGPIAFPTGTMTNEEMRKHQKALADGKKLTDITGNGKTLRAQQAAILLALKEMIPADAKGDATSVSSTDVARKLDTNVNLVCRVADTLAKKNLVKIEDDSNLEHQFYWLSLTPLGREEKAEPPTSKLPASGPGPRANFAGKRIFRLVAGNPRRENTWGWKSFNLIKDGMTYDQYKAAGGRNNDLQWDIDKKFVELRDADQPAPEPQKAPEATPPTTTKGRKPLRTGPQTKEVKRRIFPHGKTLRDRAREAAKKESKKKAQPRKEAVTQ